MIRHLFLFSDWMLKFFMYPIIRSTCIRAEVQLNANVQVIYVLSRCELANWVLPHIPAGTISVTPAVLFVC